MPAYVLADIQVKNPEAYQEYIQKVPALIAKHGGAYRARGGDAKRLEGTWEPSRLVLLEFPDREAAEAFYEDPDYTGLKHIRLNTTHTNLILFEGL